MVIGAGGLGHIGIQVLKAISAAELIVMDRNPDAVELAVAIGADHGSRRRRYPDRAGPGADRREGRRGRHRLRRGGRLRPRRVCRCFGRPATITSSATARTSTCPTIDIISTEINFIGNLVGSYNDLAELMVLAAQRKVQLHTTKYSLDDFQYAIDDLDAGQVRGRAILVP